MEPGTTTLTAGELIRAHAAGDDGRAFLRLLHPGAPDEVLSYAELAAEAERWAAFYAQRGVAPGERVIVVLRHGADLYAAYAGALLGGQVPAMFAFPSPKLSEHEYFRTVGALLRGAGARLLVTYPELAGQLLDRERDELGAAGLVTPSDLPAAVEAAPAPAIDPEATAFVQYSSGTTGLKKGVAVSHRALCWQIDAYAEAIGAGPEDRIVSWLPLYHDMGLIACFFLPLLQRIPLVAMSPFDWVARPASWLKAVSEHRGTLAWLPNFAYSFMAANVRDGDLEGVDLSSLRGVVNCSEPVRAASHDAFVRRFGSCGMTTGRLAASYAMAENTFAVTSAGFAAGPPVVEHVDGAAVDRDGDATPVAAGAPGARALVSSGRALPETEVAIVDAERRALPERRIGELALRSPCLLTEYDGNAEATAEALADGWLYTGDLGYVADGEVFVTGRRKDLVIVAGRNIYPQDAEVVAEAVAGVIPGRVVAFGVNDEREGTEGLVLLAESDAWADAERSAEIRREVYRALVERADLTAADIRIVEPRTLVKSSSGKLARGENRARYLEQRGPEPAAAPAGDGDLLAVVRSAVLGVVHAFGADAQGIADDTPLISSGLIDSLGTGELLAALESACGVAIGPEALGDRGRFDTIASIAATVASLGEHAGAAPAPLDVARIPMTHDAPPARTPAATSAWWTTLARLRLRRAGVPVGPGFRALGPVVLQLDGTLPARGLHIGAFVTLMPGAHLKTRERGRIVLHDGVKLDTSVRLVAANDATLELGEDVALGLGTVINAGADVRIGRGTMTASHCVLNASDHGIDAGAPIRSQPYVHAPIHVGEDVWLGAGVVLARGTRVGHGAVVSATTLVSGEVPAGAVLQGRPARVIKFRG